MNLFLKLSNWQLTVISGILIGVSYQPWNLGFLSYFGFIPLIKIFLNNNSKQNFKYGYFFGFIYNLISNYWIGANSGAETIIVLFSLFLATAYLALFWGFAGLLIGTLNKNNDAIFTLPFLIVILEWLRSFGPLGFDWGNLALTQVNYLSVLQFNDIFGTYFSSFIIMSVNISIYYIIKHKIKYIYYFLLAITLFLFLGNYRLKTYKPSKDNFKISIIQPNLDPKEKWNLSTKLKTLSIMDSLYNEAILLSPNLILFPETALPTYLTLDNKLRSKLQKKVNKTNIPILIGTVDRKVSSDGERIFNNSSLFMQPNKDYEIYAKMHLVPFAEYDLVPKFLHPLIHLNLNIDRGVFMGGKYFKLFEWKNVKFGNLICYESSFSRYAREYAKKGASILMIQANDGWLGTSSGPYQHFSLAILRAIENRLPVVRSGNTGISGLILPSGKVELKKGLKKRAVFLVNVPISSNNSFFSEYGDFFAVICYVIFLFIGSIKCSKEKLF